MARIKNKKELLNTLFYECYDKLAFWSDGSWTEVGTGYGGEQDGNDPVFLLSRSRFGRVLCRLLIGEVEKEINNPGPGAGSSPIDRAMERYEELLQKKRKLGGKQ